MQFDITSENLSIKVRKIPPVNEFQGGIKESLCLSVCPSVLLSVQIRVWPITFLWFDIRLPYLAHGYMTIRRCVVYIHDPHWI